MEDVMEGGELMDLIAAAEQFDPTNVTLIEEIHKFVDVV
jgi:hypothetical protein